MGLLYLFFVVMAAAFPVVRLEHLGNPFVTVWAEAALPLVQSVRWQLVVLLPASLGLYTLLIRLEVMGGGLGWMLPGLRRGWLAGELMIVIPVAAGLGRLTAEGTSVAIGVAAVGVALVAFNLPGLILHPAVGAWPKRLLAGLLVLGAVFPAQLGAGSAAIPLLVATVAVPAVLVMLRVRFSDWAARQDTIGGSGDQWEKWPLKYWGVEGEWAVSLATEKRTPWLRAVFHETGFGSTSRTIRMRMGNVAFLLVMTYAFLDYWILALWAGMLAGDRSDGLRGGLLYPVSREHRGRVMATAVLLDAAFALILLFGGVWLMDTLPLPFERNRASPDGPGLGVITTASIALLPIALWGRGRDTSAQQGFAGLGKGQLIPFLYLLAFAVIATVGIRPLQAAWDDGAHWLVAGSLSGAAIVLYSLYWYSTLRHYRRSDLGGLTT